MNINEFLPPRVAVIEMHGIIGPRVRPHEFARLLKEVRENPRYRAVVLDIDSPGGTAYASEDIYLAAKRLAEKKPLVAAVRGIGASGSYMVAMAAQRLYALPTAVIGSIGVISARPMIEDLLAKIGVEMIISTAGEHKDSGSLFRPPTDEERAREQELLDALHQRFQTIVLEGRPQLDAGTVAKLSSGEIHLGSQALDLGLVDELGDLDDAVQHAAGLAKIGPQTTVLRPRRSFAQTIMARGATALADSLGPATLEAVGTALLDRAYRRALGIPDARHP